MQQASQLDSLQKSYETQKRYTKYGLAAAAVVAPALCTLLGSKLNTLFQRIPDIRVVRHIKLLGYTFAPFGTLCGGSTATSLALMAVEHFGGHSYHQASTYHHSGPKLHFLLPYLQTWAKHNPKVLLNSEIPDLKAAMPTVKKHLDAIPKTSPKSQLPTVGKVLGQVSEVALLLSVAALFSRYPRAGSPARRRCGLRSTQSTLCFSRGSMSQTTRRQSRVATVQLPS